ncbi:peptidase inhibitor family I36 protein [Kibdelosporangium lantanae]|uniref:Peptidase inhibitor family I36 protein n=1 Tax=Kibdelosporangium lantanae TaxID=1497396 RepID=A0ABW3MF80_9PSEU
MFEGDRTPCRQRRPAPNGTVTLLRADKSTVTVSWQSGPGGALFAVDPRDKARSSGLDNAVVVRPTATGCPSGKMCIFESANWGGWTLEIPGGTSIEDLSQVPCSGCQTSSHHPASNGTFNDQMSSWTNLSGLAYCWTFNAGRQGEFHPVANGVSVNVTEHENDEASSVVQAFC